MSVGFLLFLRVGVLAEAVVEAEDEEEEEEECVRRRGFEDGGGVSAGMSERKATEEIVGMVVLAAVRGAARSAVGCIKSNALVCGSE